MARDKAIKKVTKKIVNEALESCQGWMFANGFRESQRLVLFSHANIPKMTNCIKAKGLTILELTPCKDYRTGTLGLSW